MSGKGKDIPIAGSKDNQDLKSSFTYDELLAEIGTEYAKYEERLPNDIDFHDIMEYFGICQNTAHIRMDELAQSGKFRFVHVRGKSGAPIRVIRRV